jgi:hypothetical protein
VSSLAPHHFATNQFFFSACCLSSSSTSTSSSLLGIIKRYIKQRRMISHFKSLLAFVVVLVVVMIDDGTWPTVFVDAVNPCMLLNCAECSMTPGCSKLSLSIREFAITTLLSLNLCSPMKIGARVATFVLVMKAF